MGTITETEIQKHCKRKFSHLSNIELVKRINNAPDFGWDDEEVELCRRRAVSEGKFVVQMNFSTIEIIKDETI